MTDQGNGERAEDDPGPLVRPFAVTRGRTGADLIDLDILTLVVATGPDTEPPGLDREYRTILHLCRGRALSIAEIAAHLGLLVAATKVLVNDLITAGHVIYRSPLPENTNSNVSMLRAVLDSVRQI